MLKNLVLENRDNLYNLQNYQLEPDRPAHGGGAGLGGQRRPDRHRQLRRRASGGNGGPAHSVHTVGKRRNIFIAEVIIYITGKY